MIKNITAKKQLLILGMGFVGLALFSTFQLKTNLKAKNSQTERYQSFDAVGLQAMPAELRFAKPTAAKSAKSKLGHAKEEKVGASENSESK